MSVDPKVYDLACLFLRWSADAEKDELAERIQQTIDDFMTEVDEGEFARSEQAANEIPSPL